MGRKKELCYCELSKINLRFMKKKQLMLGLLLIIGFSYNTKAQSDLKIMTYNIRYSTQNDGENWWHLRRDHVAAMLTYERPAVLGLQEALYSQVQFLDDQLMNYTWIGVGRDDGKIAGEFSPIFFDTTRVELVPGTSKTFWLSETPGSPSKSWDAAFPRIVTYARFRDKTNDSHFWAFNTHFDHVGQVARMNSISMIQHEISMVVGDDPYLLIGDFNVTEDNPVYKLVTNGLPELYDAMKREGVFHVGPDYTFEGFKVLSGGGRRIDYIFVSQRVEVCSHAHLAWFRNGNYLSDHLPVVVIINDKR
jgi:endonuclease/exonuclease/phosphatase family metal-dependent hydrolase